MKRAFLVWLMATILLLSGSVAWSATITIYDPEQSTPVNPTVTATGFDPLYFSTPVIDTAPEYAHATGIYYTAASIEMSPGSLPVTWLESAGGAVSDFMIFTIFEPNRTDYTQKYEVTFWSKGAAGFDAALAAYSQAFPNSGEEGVFAFVEDGTPRGWANQVTAIGVCGAPVPVPGSLVLLGSGFLSLVGLRRFRKP